MTTAQTDVDQLTLDAVLDSALVGARTGRTATARATRRAPVGAVSVALLLAALPSTTTTALRHEYQEIVAIGAWSSGTATARIAAMEAPTADVVRDEVPMTLGAAIGWLHNTSGLTWDQIGRLLGVSRRTVHLWASGAGINATNADRISRLVRLVQAAPGSGPDEKRAALLLPGSDGRSLLDAFRASQSDDRINAPTVRATVLLDAHDDLAVTDD